MRSSCISVEWRKFFGLVFGVKLHIGSRRFRKITFRTSLGSRADFDEEVESALVGTMTEKRGGDAMVILVVIRCEVDDSK